MGLLALATQTADQWWGLGAIGVLGAVVAYLFKLYHGRNVEIEKASKEQAKAHAEELGKRDEREVRIRSDCNAQLHAQAEKHAAVIERLHLECRAHEDTVRKEFAAVVEAISTQAEASTEGVTKALEKIYDHLAAPRGFGPRRH